MKKQIVRLTENDLQNVIRKAVQRIIRETTIGSVTPYKEGEGKKMWDANQKRSPEERNPYSKGNYSWTDAPVKRKY